MLQQILIKSRIIFVISTSCKFNTIVFLRTEYCRFALFSKKKVFSQILTLDIYITTFLYAKIIQIGVLRQEKMYIILGKSLLIMESIFFLHVGEKVIHGKNLLYIPSGFIFFPPPPPLINSPPKNEEKGWKGKV